MSPSNHPDDEAAAIRDWHRYDDAHPDYAPDDPRDLPGVADQGARDLVDALWAAAVARQAARRERELDE
jgi:hypothetical protein